jgi:ABC-type transport system substrate-binding protein
VSVARRPLRAPRHLVANAVAAWLAAASTGCSGELPAPLPAAHPDDPTPRRGGTVRTSTFGDIRGLDPANIADGLVSSMHQLLFAGLVDFDERGAVVPRLAERIDAAPDGLQYRFTLRRGVLFHDGTELTADDVKRSVERALHPSAPNPYSTFYSSIFGYDDFANKRREDLAGVTVEGSHVVTFRLSQPDSTFLPLLAMQPLRPVCKSAGRRFTDDFLACGAGPFKLAEGGWVRGQSLTLVRHDGYYEPGKPYLDRVVFTFGMTLSTSKYKFTHGELDALRDLTQGDVLRFAADPRWRPLGEYERERQIMGEAMNTEVAPFDNVEIRRAVAAAIDRRHYEAVKPSLLRAANQPIPPGTPGYDPGQAGQQTDLAQALEHMRRAGYPYDPVTKTGGYPHVIPYYTYRQGASEYTAQVFQQEVAKIGLRIELRLVNYPTYLAQIARRRQVAIGPWGWSEDYPDAIDFLDSLFHSRSIADEDANNVSFYSNPRFDALVDSAKRELEPKRRARLVSEAVDLVCDEAPFAFAYTVRFYEVHQPYLRGYRPHPVWARDVSSAWIDRAMAGATRGAVVGPGALGSLFGR